MKTKEEKFTELFRLETTHIKNGLVKWGKAEQERWDELIIGFTEEENAEYERRYYGIKTKG